MNISEQVKDHPVISVGVVLAGGLILYYLLAGSKADNIAQGYTVAPDQSQVGAATALQTAQLQAQSVSQQIDAAVRVKESDNEAAKYIADLASKTSVNNNTILAGVETSRIAAAKDVALTTTTLEAQTAENAQNKQVEAQSIITKGQTEQQQILANALIAQSGSQAAVATAAITGNYLTNQALINKQPAQSLWSKIFG